MSDHDKMMAFGHWLTLRKDTILTELVQLSVNANHAEAKIRVKAGHLEGMQHVLEAFMDLYKHDVGRFNAMYLGVPEEEEESDGVSSGST